MDSKNTGGIKTMITKLKKGAGDNKINTSSSANSS